METQKKQMLKSHLEVLWVQLIQSSSNSLKVYIFVHQRTFYDLVQLDEVQASYEAVYRPQVSEGDEEFYPIRSYQAVVTNSEGNTSDSNSSEDSFNPYD